MLGFGWSGSIFAIGLTMCRDIMDEINTDNPMNAARNTAISLIFFPLTWTSVISITEMEEITAAAADQIRILINIFLDNYSSPAL